MDSGRNVILIPTDFSEACTNAIEHGVELAKNFNSDVYILHVLNKDTKVYLQKNKLKIEDLQLQLDEIVDSIKLQHDLEVRTEIKKGSIFNEINLTAKEIEACMVVLGTHGKKGFQHIFGSHAMRIIMSSDIPVIVVQNRAYGCGYENIVFPVNESIEIEQKVDWAIKLAKVFNSKIHVYKYKETDPEIVSNINSVNQQILSAFEHNKVEFIEKEAESESAYSTQLLDYAVSKSADLILIMTNNDEFEPSFILGAPEEKMIYNPSQIPVMCINPKN